MATSMVSIPKDTWTLISTVSVSFQNISNHDIYVIEAASLPENISVRKVLAPLGWYSFTKLDGNLYGYSPVSSANIAIDPVA